MKKNISVMKNKCLSTSFLLIDSFFQSNPFHVKGLGFDGDAENNLSQEPDGIYLSNRVKLSKQYWDTLNSVLLPELRISCNREYIIPSKKGVTKELPDFAQDISDAKIKIDRFQDEFYIEGAIYFLGSSSQLIMTIGHLSLRIKHIAIVNHGHLD